MADEAATLKERARRLERIHSGLPLGVRERLFGLLLGKAVGAKNPIAC